MRRLVLVAALTAACVGGPETPTIGRWNMEGCPQIDSGVYLRELEVCQATDVREVYMGGDGAWDTGCVVVDSRRRGDTCSRDVTLECPGRTYVGRVTVPAAGLLLFEGDVLTDQTCRGSVTLTWLRPL